MTSEFGLDMARISSVILRSKFKLAYEIYQTYQCEYSPVIA